MSETTATVTITGVHPEDENQPGTRIEVIYGDDLGKVVAHANAQLAKGWRTWLGNDHIVSKGRKWISGNEREDVTVFTVTLLFARNDPSRELTPDNMLAVISKYFDGIIVDDDNRRTLLQKIVLGIWEKFFSGKR